MKKIIAKQNFVQKFVFYKKMEIKIFNYAN